MLPKRFKINHLRLFLLVIISLVIATFSLVQANPLLQGRVKTPIVNSDLKLSKALNPKVPGFGIFAPKKTDSIRVNATLVLKVFENQNSTKTIRMAERLVYLKEYESNKSVDTGVTQLDGKLNLSAPIKGVYAVCWKVENIADGCSRAFEVKDKTVFLGNLVIDPQSNYAYGDTLMKEDRPCWLNDPYFKIDLFTEVSIIGTKGNVAASPVKANVSGEYVIGLPKGDRYLLRSTCEKTVYKTAQFIGAANNSHINLPLDNYAPHKEELAAFKDGRGITRASAGSTIVARLLTSDKDADPVEISWKILDGSGSLAGTNGEKEKWSLPSQAGMHQIYVMARDGQGGYLIERLQMQVGVTNLNFSGITVDEVTRFPIANARIDVLGTSTKTNADGWFSLKVPELAGEQRYPLNINHRQYATYSRILDKSSRGNTYELIQAQVTQHDPEQPIDIIDQRSSGPCGFGDPERHFEQEKDSSNREGKEPIDRKLLKKRNLRLAKPDENCRRRGARLQLPAGALVNADQTPAEGPISLSMATLDPARRTLPGDYRATDAKNDPVELVSFGALFAEFKDVNGKPVNLKKGVEALLSIPVSDAQAPMAKNTIPMWSYQEKTGLWVEEGQGDLKNTSEGLMYVGGTQHFSTINMDVAGDDPDNATCVRLEVGNSLSAWSNLVLRAYVPVGGTAVQVKETALDNAQYHAIFRIPYSDPPAGNTLRLELQGELPNGDLVVLLEEIIATDLRPKMEGEDLWPDSPYTECGTPIVLEADPVDLPYYGDIDSTGRPAFLTGPYGTYLPVDGIQTSADYYAAIDPGNNKTTLGDWWVANSFSATGGGGTRASYLNHNDLGFGRDMHCLGNNSDYACYVTNYGLPDQNPSNADDAVSQNPATQGATVTMEYHQATGDTAVSFYAYNGGVATSTRIQFADLDGLGPKPIPHLCMVCHGGTPGEFASDNLVHDAVFREFDLPSFKYSGNRSWDFAPTPNTLTPAELTNFADINSDVAAINSGNKIEELIDAWYQGGVTTPAQLNNAQIPSGWAGHEDTYRDLYGTTCRTCHIARPDIIDTFNSFQFSDYTVCGNPKVMPNAYITYKNFWSDLIRVGLYEAATGNANCFD